MTNIITVNDLIKELQKWDKDLPVLIESSYGEYSPTKIRFINYEQCDNCNYPNCNNHAKKLVLFSEDYLEKEKEYEEAFGENYEGEYTCRRGLSKKVK